MNTQATVQQIAAYRVSIKRQLRLAGVEFDNNATTETLESLLTQSQDKNDKELVVVTFNGGKEKGQKIVAKKVVKSFEEQRIECGRMFIDKYTYVSYLYEGMFYGSEYFYEGEGTVRELVS